MRIVEKLLYGIGGLLALILLFILLCHFNPQLAQDVGETLATQSQENLPTQTVSVDTAQENDTQQVSSTPESNNLIAVSSTGEQYEIPDEAELEIPQETAGLNGRTPLWENAIEITQSRAEELAQTLSMGNTGADLTFDEEMYPYYAMLGDTAQALYRQIYANANDVTEHFAPVTQASAAELKNAFLAVCNDHPELFWLETAYQYYYAPNGSISEIDLSFYVIVNQLETAKTAFEAAADRIITQAQFGHYGDYAKEVFVHDALIADIVYDRNAPMNQSAYSALVNGRTVCAGYARAFQYIMQQLEVPCYYVTGYAGENHAWNIIKLEDGYYNVDTTWDDTDPNTYDYFNCSDADYAKDHVRRELSVYLPPCRGERYRDLEENPVQENDTDTDYLVLIPGQLQTDTTNTTTDTQQTQSDTTQEQSTDTQEDGTIAVSSSQNTNQSYDLIGNIEDYYRDCLSHLLDTQNTQITFTNAVADQKLWDKIVKAYEKGDYEEGFTDRVLAEKHLSRCTIDVEAQQQSDGSFVVRHTVRLY